METANGMRIMLSPYVVPGNDEHVQNVTGRLRKADCEEVLAATGRDPDEMLRVCWNNSLYRWAIIWDREAIGLFGVHPFSLTGFNAVPWMLGTDRMEEIKLSIVRHSKSLLDQVLTLYPILSNWVDVRNEMSIKWLKWLGFTLSDEPMPYGPKSMPFYYFKKIREGYHV